VLRVTDNIDPSDFENRWRLLTNGRINHGTQYHDLEKSRLPTTYYTAHSGVGLAIDHHPRRFSADPDQQSLRIGVVGLGTGTLAAAGRAGDTILFYEINPVVLQFAQQYFRYTKDSRAKVQVALGDARIQMKRQLAEGGSQQFDVLAIDAFSSDAIPVHLLTKESVELYLQHLKPDGILCIHISNLFLDLGSVVRAIAAELDIPCVFIDSSDKSDFASYYSTWAVLTRNQSFLDDPAVDEAIWKSDNADNGTVLWTDDYASLWRVLKKPTTATTNDSQEAEEDE
jgi:spermidine synthase